MENISRQLWTYRRYHSNQFGLLGRIASLTVAILAVTVSTAFGQPFLYAPNAGGSVTGYAVNSTTGALVPLPGSPFPASGSPQHAAVDPNSHFLYVNKPDLGNISVFGIHPISGALTETPGSPFTNQWVVGLAIEPRGKFLYAENPSPNTVSGLVLDPQTGALMSSVPGSPFATGPFPYDTMTVHPSGRFLYQTNAALYGGQASVSGFLINLLTGALSPVPGSPTPVTDPANNITVEPTGRFAYASAAGNIYGFSIDQTTGSLSSIPGSPFRAVSSNAGVIADHLGHFVFLAGGQDSTLSAFQIDQSTGALSHVPGSPYTIGSYLSGMAVDPANNFLYVALWNSIAAFRIDRNSGALSQVPGSPFPAGSVPGYLVIATPTHRYQVCLSYDQTRPVRSGATLAIKLLLCDDVGSDVSSSLMTLHATGIVLTSTSVAGDVQAPGNANPDNDFQFDPTLGSSGGYRFNLSTKGLTTGSYILNFVVTGDSHIYAAPFQVR